MMTEDFHDYGPMPKWFIPSFIVVFLIAAVVICGA